jgi:response regulator RpfG family c-di-GMP phosphodiesterase
MPVKTRIVAVTAMSSEAHRRKGIVECGIDVWLSKPVGIKAMREVIEKAKDELLGYAIAEEAAGNEG